MMATELSTRDACAEAPPAGRGALGCPVLAAPPPPSPAFSSLGSHTSDSAQGGGPHATQAAAPFSFSLEEGAPGSALTHPSAGITAPSLRSIAE